MNGERGNGYGAEYGNNTVDKMRFRDVENAADRIVDGEIIQTKYCRRAKESIGAAFDSEGDKYTYDNGSKMMAIEVPRNQYRAALIEMQNKIDNNKVPGAKPGDDARKYVKKGYFTYEQSFNICKSGSRESITVDLTSGVIAYTHAGGITVAITFASALWDGKSVEEAAQMSLMAGAKVVGKGAAIYTLTMQLSRRQIINPFLGKQYIFTDEGEVISQGFKGANNPIFVVSEKLASKIRFSSAAKSTIGRRLGLSNASGKAVIRGGVTVAITFGPDICRALVGRISPKQLFKNASVGAVGIAGATIVQTIIPVPIVGAMVCATVAGFVAKKVLDKFIEDYAREFARCHFVSTAVINVLSTIRKVTNNLVNQGFTKFIETPFQEVAATAMV